MKTNRDEALEEIWPFPASGKQVHSRGAFAQDFKGAFEIIGNARFDATFPFRQYDVAGFIKHGVLDRLDDFAIAASHGFGCGHHACIAQCHHPCQFRLNGCFGVIALTMHAQGPLPTIGGGHFIGGVF